MRPLLRKAADLITPTTLVYELYKLVTHLGKRPRGRS
jgi:hypothetical protein